MNVVYEHAITEHLRLLIRIEAMFLELDKCLNFRQKDFGIRGLFNLIDLSELTGGQDLHFDLLKDLHKKDKSFRSLIHNPDVDMRLLEATLKQIDDNKKKIHALKSSQVSSFDNDEFIQIIKRKYRIKGSLYPCELPLLNFWVNQNEQFHLDRIHSWLGDFLPISGAVKLILRLTRESVTAASYTAKQGVYQQALENKPSIDLIRIILGPNSGVFPEISGNKHKFAIRFLTSEVTSKKPVQTIDSIEFELGLGTL